MESWNISPSSVKNLLSAAWLFDEGIGEKAWDFVAGKEFKTLGEMWNNPEWVASDLRPITSRQTTVLNYTFTSELLRESAEEYCSEIYRLGHSELCLPISRAVTDFYFISCVQFASMMQHKEAGRSQVVQFAELCETSSDIPFLQFLHKKYFDNHYLCHFGTWTRRNNSHACVCQFGYFGDTCSEVCPGGSWNPCNGHGHCQQNGICECQWNWDGKNCDLCSKGMIGNNCSVAKTAPLTAQGSNIAMVFSTGQYLRFDGRVFELSKETGVFRIYLHDRTDAQIHQTLCQTGTCINAFSLSVDSTVLTIYATENKGIPEIFINGSRFRLDQLQLNISKISLTVKSTSEIYVSLQLKGTVTFKIIIQAVYLTISVKSHPSICKAAVGLLGSCDPSTLTFDFETSTEVQRSQYFQQYKIDIVNSLFNKDIRLLFSPFSAGYALLFNNTAALTKPIIIKQRSKENSSGYSISLLVKPYSHTGVMISFGNKKTFALFNTNPISLTCGQKTQKTKAVNILHSWNQIIVIFDKNSSRVHFYHYDPNRRITYNILDLTCPDIYESENVISLGAWHPSFGNAKFSLANQSFTGLLDEITVWNSALSISTIYQTFHLNTKLSYFGNQLDFLYRFSEGHGYSAQDGKSGNNIFLPAYPWQTPVWVYSDVSLYSLRKTINDRNDVQPDLEAIQICKNYFGSRLLRENCPRISAIFLETFIHICAFHSSLSTKNIYLSIASIGDMCMNLGGKQNEINELICNTTAPKPDWLKLMCSNCMFGRLQTNGTCICDYGYWGQMCDKTCPNGALKPCSFHGLCDTNGQCICKGQWTGEKCDQCLPGWIGSDCVVMKRNFSSLHTTQLTAFIYNKRIKTFDLVSFDVNLKGVYRLLTIRPDNLTLFAQFMNCNESDSVDAGTCYVSFLVNGVGIELVVNVTSFADSSKTVIWDNRKAIQLYRNLSYKDIQMTRHAEKYFEMVFARQQLIVNVELKDQLFVTLSTTLDARPRLTNGLLCSCDTVRDIGYRHCNIEEPILCDSTMSVSCREDLSSTSVQEFLKSYLVNTPDDQTDINLSSGGCLCYSNNGMYIKNVSLYNEFTLELHVNPTKYGGIIYSFITLKCHLLLLNSVYGLTVISGGSLKDTKIPLELNKWNQIDLVWISATSSLEIYVIHDSGETLVKAVHISSETFNNSGTFILGSTSEELQNKYSLDEGFYGYIDEVRIWKRPHNPTLITRNWRIKVSRATPDLKLSWNFNKMENFFARDMQQGVIMYPLQLSRAPTWHSSTLELKSKPNIEIATPPVTAANTSLVNEARELCSSVFNGALMNYCRDVGEDLSKYYLQECIKDVVVTTNPTKSAKSAMMFAKECQASINSTDKDPVNLVCEYLGSKNIVLSSPECQRDCLFGFLNATNFCTCSEGFFGDKCDKVCPVAERGVCNLKGDCISETKSCECSSHWLGMSHDLISYWSGLLSNSTTYACDNCSPGWVGDDCNILQLDTVNNNETSQKRVGIVFGPNVMTFDAVAYTIITVGSYQLLSTEELAIKGYFLPCLNDYLCRTLTSVSFMLDVSTTFEVTQRGEDLVLLLKKDDLETNITYPTSRVITSTTKPLKVSWTQRRIVRVSIHDTEILISLVDSEMFFGVFLSHTKKKMRGIMGNNDGYQGNDISSEQIKNIALMGDSVSIPTIGKFLKTNFKIHLGQDLTNSGYKLIFNENFAQALDLSLITLPRLTVGFWIQFKSKLNVDTTFIHFLTNNGKISLGLSEDFLVIKHFNKVYNTDMRIHLDRWLYIVLVWGNKDPNTIAYIFSQSSLQYFQYKNEHIDSILDITEIKITAYQISFELDYLRLWNSTHSVADIHKHYNVYTNKLLREQVLHIMFDEGEGSMSYVHSTSTWSGDGKSFKSRLTFGPSGTSLPEWKPSDLPVLEQYSAVDLRMHTMKPTIRENCLRTLENPIFENHCKNLQMSQQFFIESCIRMSRLGTPVGNLTRDLYAIYCKERLDIDACVFKGFLDFCNENDAKLSVIIIIIIIVCVLILCGICICCIYWIFVYKKKRSKFAYMSNRTENTPRLTMTNIVNSGYEPDFDDCDDKILQEDELDFVYDNPVHDDSDI